MGDVGRQVRIVLLIRVSLFDIWGRGWSDDACSFELDG